MLDHSCTCLSVPSPSGLWLAYGDSRPSSTGVGAKSVQVLLSRQCQETLFESRSKPQGHGRIGRANFYTSPFPPLVGGPLIPSQSPGAMSMSRCLGLRL